MAANLSEFTSRLSELVGTIGQEETFATLISAMDTKLQELGASDALQIVIDIQHLIEDKYGLKKDVLINSFSNKDRETTDPKKVWVMICLKLFNNDRKKVLLLIGNGLSRQKVFTCFKEIDTLQETVPHHKKMINVYNEIIEAYG